MLVLASKFPESLPELIAYQLLIVQHSIKFRYPSWLHYDTEFRQWAAVYHHKKWSQINPQIYALAFTGQGTSVSWCPMCQVDGGNHTYDCPRFATPLSGAHLRQSQPEPILQPRIFPRALNPIRFPPAKRSRPDHCILFNKNNGACPYGDSCIYKHRCAHCGREGHPVSRCPSKSA